MFYDSACLKVVLYCYCEEFEKLFFSKGDEEGEMDKNVTNTTRSGSAHSRICKRPVSLNSSTT
jgi:hypothetical protein